MMWWWCSDRRDQNHLKMSGAKEEVPFLFRGDGMVIVLIDPDGAIGSGYDKRIVNFFHALLSICRFRRQIQTSSLKVIMKMMK